MFQKCHLADMLRVCEDLSLFVSFSLKKWLEYSWNVPVWYQSSRLPWWNIKYNFSISTTISTELRLHTQEFKKGIQAKLASALDAVIVKWIWRSIAKEQYKEIDQCGLQKSEFNK